MSRPTKRWGWVLAMVSGLVWADLARAQRFGGQPEPNSREAGAPLQSRAFSPPPAPAMGGYSNPIPNGFGTPYSAPYANPFVSPYANPYLNPYMTAVPMSPDVGLLYLLGSQRASGGLGSGRLSGVRSASDAAARPAALMPHSSSRAGAGAEKYFGRGPGRSDAAGAYYQRYNRYYGR